VTEDKAKQLIALYGLPVVVEELVREASEAARAAARLGYPTVAKVISPDIPHKAQIGGVRLGLRTATEAEAAFSSIMASIAARQPAARIHGVLMQRMVGDGIETIMGLKRDRQFGLTILFGLGGVLVEALRQVAVRLVPIGEADALEMIEGVPALTAILDKQGGGRTAVATLVQLLLGLSELAVELEDDIEELDLNPVILQPATARATVVDALIVRRNRER
jgi:acetyltransferase